MSNFDWVISYIDNLLSSGNRETDQATLIRSKLEYINIPFYKYCFIQQDENRTADTVDYSIQNFENDLLFFQDPSKFNDPFDCFLGFSSSQMIRDLLTVELKRREGNSADFIEAIKGFFSDGLFEEPSVDLVDSLLDNENVRSLLIEILTNSFGEDNKYIINALDDIFFSTSEKRAIFMKLINNTLTIKDKQAIVDMIYGSEYFIKHLEHQLDHKTSKLVRHIGIQDAKLKIETDPSGLFSEHLTQTTNPFDFFQLALDSVLGNNNLELNKVKELFVNVSKETLEKSRELISRFFKVTCLSERMDSPLMWSHYANKHFGFCLEYDFTYSLIKNYPDLYLAQLMLFPVYYSRNRPLISEALFKTNTIIDYKVTKSLPPEFIKNIMVGLLYKSEDWAYEREWRILNINGDTSTMRLPPPRKVFLGANMEEAPKRRLIGIAQKKHIPVYQMLLSPDKYKFDCYKVI